MTDVTAATADGVDDELAAEPTQAEIDAWVAASGPAARRGSAGRPRRSARPTPAASGSAGSATRSTRASSASTRASGAASTTVARPSSPPRAR